MLDPNSQVSVTLNAQQWNTVLTQLAEGPYRLVASLMQTIAQQCEAHAQTPVTRLRQVDGGEQP